MHARFVFLLPSLLMLVTLQGAPQPPAAVPPAPVLVELFTSEGCSDCPPADDLLNAMARGQSMNFNVIPLAFHVTYWDQDGWRDRFSDSSYTARQQDYQGWFHTKAIYTPQAVVDGEYETVGNNPGRVFGLIRKAAAEPRAASVRVSVNEAEVTVEAQGALHGSQKIWLAITEDDLATDVKAGENRSRTLHHSAVVRQLASIGKLKDGAFTRTVPLKLKSDWHRDKLHAVVFVQDEKGRIMGAGTTRLSSQAAGSSGAR
ncbi:MAG: DUF1223 domain-containing protein [Acidobacteria bacterium]|nr:DUF1223 domain-containing protein [Acidobacteriota bacterium]